jgi:hypothetical protein
MQAHVAAKTELALNRLFSLFVNALARNAA